MQRRSFIASSGAFAAAASFAAPLRAQTGPKILVGYWPVAAALPFFVGANRGIFKDAGVDVELVKFADQVKVTEALLAGRIHATATGTGSTQLALAEIAQPNFFKILGANLSSDKSILDEFIVAKGASYKKVADLKGKKIATGVGPQAMIEAKTILAKAGVDVTPVELSPAQHIAAVSSGQVDASYSYEPYGTVGRLSGAIDILEVGVRSRYLLGNASAPWYGGAAVITTEFLKAEPAAAKRYIAGIKKSFEFVRKDLNAARAVFPAYTPFDMKLAEAIPPISYTFYDEFKASDIGYFQANYDLFLAEKVFTRKLDVSGMLYKA